MDGHALVFRSWYAIQNSLTVRSTGEEVKGVFGFTNMFLRALREWNPTHCAIAFDHKGPTFRDLRYDKYKANRAAPPPQIYSQIALVRRLMEAFRVPIYEIEGYEADDTIGTLARQSEQLGMETIILTGDTDTFQLVTPRIRVDLQARIQNRKVYDTEAVRERFGGLPPEKQPEIKALYGDTSDNIPGVKGIGEKTAIKLIIEHGSLEQLYANIDVIPARVQEMLRTGKEQAFLSRELGTIVVDVPTELSPDTSRFWQYDRKEVLDFLKGLEFYNIIDRIPEGMPTAPPGEPSVDPLNYPNTAHYSAVLTQVDLDLLIKELQNSNGFAMAVQPSLAGIAFSTSSGRAWYVPLNQMDVDQATSDQTLQQLRGVLENQSIPKVAHNAAAQLTILLKNGIEVKNLVSDTMVAAHLGNQKNLTLRALALQVQGVELPALTNLLGAGTKRRSINELSTAELTQYAGGEADLTLQLRDPLEQDSLNKGGFQIYNEAQLPLIPVLARMQVTGIALDVGVLSDMSTELGNQIHSLEIEIFDDVGHEFNINSPQQLSGILFDELGLRKTKRTRTGSHSTDAAALEGLRGGELAPAHRRIIDNLLAIRQESKLKSTYIDALPSLVDTSTGRLHTNYNLAGSATGRLASSDPNLMNIPIRTEQGRRVRRAFTAGPPEWLLLAADYSQIELRILAHLSKDPALTSSFERGEDIHATTASQMFQVNSEEVTPDMRRMAKIMNFGVIYGLSAFGVSQQIGFSVEKGNQFIDTYFNRYPGVQQYINETKQKAHNDGYVSTILGRRRYLPDISSPDFNVRQAAERMAVNAPVQGTAAEIIQLAMINIDRWMQEHKLASNMLLQVHDELIFEVPQEELDTMKASISSYMSSAMDLLVPLQVELKQGKNWGDME